MLQRYPTIRKLAPQFLSTLVFRGHAVAANLLRARSVIADLYRTGKCAIRLIPATESGSIRPSIPVYCGHRIRLIAASLWTTVINLSG